mgnify:CR=1 FL=1
MISFVKGSGGIQYAQEVMEKYYKEALEILDSFEASVYKTSLYELVKYTIEREK